MPTVDELLTAMMEAPSVPKAEPAPDPERQRALEHETVLRKVTDATLYHATEDARFRLQKGEPNMPYRIIMAFLEELGALSSFTSFPYPITAEIIGREVRRVSRSNVGAFASMVEAKCWPLVKVNDWFHIPATVVPIFKVYEREVPVLPATKAAMQRAVAALERETTHAQRIAAAMDLQHIYSLNNGEFTVAVTKAHHNALLAPAGLCIAAKLASKLGRRRDEWASRIWDHTRYVRPTGPERVGHGYLTEPYYGNTEQEIVEGLEGARRTADVLAERMGEPYGCAHLPASESLHAGGNRCAFFLIARQREIALLPNSWRRG